MKETIHPKVQKILDTGASVVCVTVDLTKKKEVEREFKKIEKIFGDAPTVLINNAGLATHPGAPKEESGPFEAYPEAVWDSMLDSHLKSAFFCSQSFIASYRQAKKVSGSIVNISSTYGVVSPQQEMYRFRRTKGRIYFKPVGYNVAKSGMLGLTRWLAEYCAYEKTGIRVNCLLPGGVQAGQDKAFIREYEKRTMLGRMAKNTDYNGAILFLVSDASSYMTGAMLTVDGGWTAR